MKRLMMMMMLVAVLAGLSALAQGRISFQTDSLHLVYYYPGFGPLGGEAVSATNMPSGVTLVADLYMGTSSSLLSYYSTTTFGSIPGKWSTLNLTAPTIPGGTTVFVVAQIRDEAFAPPSTWVPFTPPFGSYYGVSEEFTFVLGTSALTYPPMYTTGASSGGGFSTWTDGTYDMDFLAPGFRGAIAIPAPEPGAIALAGFGALVVWCARKRAAGLN